MSTPLRVLFVEDSVDDVELLVHALTRAGYEIEYERVQTAAELRFALEHGPFDVIFSDYSMPGFDALQALEIVREHGELPFLIVSGTMGEETAVTAMKAGATDFLMKGSLTRLIPSLNRELREAADRQLRKGLQDQLARVSRLEALGRLASGIAHDFNNLLMVIAGSSELMLEMLTERDPLREEIDEILKATRHGTALTSQLLSFSRKQTLAPRPVNLNEVIRSLERLLRRAVGPSVELELELSPDLRRTCLDPHQFEQVLINLAVNARDAMPGGGRLRIATSNHVEVVRLLVQDNGSGMDPETLSRVFEPFYTTKGPHAGTGLGLATVYGIVAQSGGTIEVESEVGEGSIFRIELPVETSIAPERVQLSPDKVCLLLVEDDAAVRRVVQRILERAGYEVLPAGDGGAARRLLERHGSRVQLILSDILLADENGVSLARELLVLRPGLRLLFTSGSRHSFELCAPLGESVTTLEKPFLPEQLLAAVARALPGA